MSQEALDPLLRQFAEKRLGRPVAPADRISKRRYAHLIIRRLVFTISSQMHEIINENKTDQLPLPRSSCFQ